MSSEKYQLNLASVEETEVVISEYENQEKKVTLKAKLNLSLKEITGFQVKTNDGEVEETTIKDAIDIFNISI